MVLAVELEGTPASNKQFDLRRTISVRREQARSAWRHLSYSNSGILTTLF
jgi:hypothetical protein